MEENILENIYYLGTNGSNAHNAMLKFMETNSINVKEQTPKKSIKSTLQALEKDFASIF